MLIGCLHISHARLKKQFEFHRQISLDNLIYIMNLKNSRFYYSFLLCT
jgi:hypothetical protein